MNEVPNESNYEEENDAMGGRSTSARRRSPTLTQESTSERKLNDLIFAINNMMGAITTMQQ